MVGNLIIIINFTEIIYSICFLIMNFIKGCVLSSLMISKVSRKKAFIVIDLFCILAMGVNKMINIVNIHLIIYFI